MNEKAAMTSETLASSDLGNVFRCPGGCVHVSLQNFSFRLSERQYWQLVELFSKASIALRSLAARAH